MPALRASEQNINYDANRLKMTTLRRVENCSQTMPVVLIDDLHGMLDEVFAARNIQLNEPDILFKIGIDGGQGFFKVCLNVITEQDNFTCISASKEGSVKGLFILAIVPEIEEIYRNVQICLDNIDGIEDLPYIVATDLKIANILCGLQSHGSQHPCCYCEGTSGVWERGANSRTLRNIRYHYQRWIHSGGNLNESKNHYNCVNEPLLTSRIRDKDETILTIIPPSELHLLMGVFNKIYQEMKLKWPNVDEMWSEKLFVRPVGYHGGSCFTGGDCRKLLQSVDSLAAVCPIQVLPFVDTLRKLCQVIDSCFGNTLQMDFQEKYQSLQ